MDSKLKRRAIFISILMILLVISLTVLANWARFERKMAAWLPVEEEDTAESEIEILEGAQESPAMGDELSEEELKAFLNDETFFDK